MIMQINNNYDFTDKNFMYVFNIELQGYTNDFGWAYNPEARELDLNIPEETDIFFLEKYGEIENTLQKKPLNFFITKI